jgi:pyruvate,water dikinase
MFQAALASSGRFMAWRERTKTAIIKEIHEIRMVLRELGRRMVARGALTDPRDLLMVLDSELDGFVANPEQWGGVVAERKAAYLELFQLEPPFILTEVTPLSGWSRKKASGQTRLASGQQLRGLPGASGKARGPARVVLDPFDPRGLQPGDVLVAPLTDPSWTPLFVTAAALVVNTGASISHAVIVSRELGLPCVISAADATDRIPDGAMVEVDGDTGLVTVL